MSLYIYHAVANGLRTDHPIPDLPFVDDSHIPVDDPARVEAIGRRPGTDMWGREDRVGSGEGWVAFTTDPIRHDLAWFVRWHPGHGRSVVLYRDNDIASVHSLYAVLEEHALLFRAGGYWWDGSKWYRPDQVWDAASESYYRRKVPAATTVTAADLLTAGGDPARGKVLAIEEVNVDEPPPGRWLDHLALWAERHRNQDSPTGSVVTLTAPELAADQMVTAAQMADITGIAASTLRAYISRDEADVPLPQAVINGRSFWARPVAEEWAEQRQRSAEGVAEAVSAGHPEKFPPGITDISNRLTRSFFARLWESPAIRKRWALRWRTEAAVRDIAEGLSWDVAVSLDRIIPVDALSATIVRAVIDELRYGQELSRSIRQQDKLHLVDPDDQDDDIFYGITPPVARMLDWLIRHDPPKASYAIAQITGEAWRRLGISREVCEHSLRTALSLDGKLDQDTRDQFLNRVFTPDTDRHAKPL
jgi:hypothetical protein